MRWHFLIVLLLAGGSALAQESAPAVPRENQLQSDFRRESEHIKEACAFSFKGFFNCAEEFATDHPIHLALGSIAPQNGFGFGLAFVTHYTPNESWRISWDFDGVGATSASWRAGGYMKIIHTPVQHITVVDNPTGKPAKSNLAVRYLYRLQRLRAGNCAEPVVLLRSRSVDIRIRQNRFRYATDHRWRERHQAADRVASHPPSKSLTARRGQRALRQHSRQSWRIDSIHRTSSITTRPHRDWRVNPASCN